MHRRWKLGQSSCHIILSGIVMAVPAELSTTARRAPTVLWFHPERLGNVWKNGLERLTIYVIARGNEGDPTGLAGIGAPYRGTTSQIMKSSSVWRILSATNSTTVASSTKPRTGVASGMRSNGSIR